MKKKIALLVAVLLVGVIALTSCTITIGGDVTSLAVENVEVEVGGNAPIIYTVEGLTGDLEYSFDSDCISITNDTVYGLKEGTVYVLATIEDLSVEFEVVVTAAPETNE